MAEDSAAQTGGQVGDQAHETGNQAGDGSAQQTTSRLASQFDRLAGTMGTAAQALRQRGQRLGEQNHRTMSQYADRAAQQMERVSAYLREQDVRQKIQRAAQTAESAARRAGPLVRRVRQSRQRAPHS